MRALLNLMTLVLRCVLVFFRSHKEQWVIQQLREAFPYDSAPGYLIYDNDAIFSDKVTEAIEYHGMEPKRPAYRSPWQNGTVERWVGTARRE